MNKARLNLSSNKNEVVYSNDFEDKLINNPSLRDYLACCECGVKITFTKSHYRNGKKIDAIFRDIQSISHANNCSLAISYSKSRTGKSGGTNLSLETKFGGLIDMFRQHSNNKDVEYPEANDEKDARNSLGRKSSANNGNKTGYSKSKFTNILSKLANGHDITTIKLKDNYYDVISIRDISEEDIGEKNAFWGKAKLYNPSDKRFFLVVCDGFKPSDGITIKINEKLHDLIKKNINNNIIYFLLVTSKIDLNQAEFSNNKFSLFIGEKSIACFI